MQSVFRCALPAMWLSGIMFILCRSAETSKNALLEALEPVLLEETARGIVEPHLDDLKKLDPLVIEKIVSRQWWGLARDIVAKGHTQQVDFSFGVRRAVKSLKDEADELLRTLNPKYGLAQQVSPAFQWAQNDTSIFLTIKYTVRWNAPGALEATDISVNMSANSFNFSGDGKHSNNKYRYVLGLSLFDVISPASSNWNAASVGKMSVTLRKKWPRKWPRLLANKKTKISNMHMWMEMQEKMDSSLSGMTSAANSPITCAASEKLYCLATDTCKKAANCSQCPGKHVPQEDEHVCTGMPTEKASLTFKDADMDEHEVGGEVKITKARNEFDIDSYAVYFGKDDHSKLEREDGTGWLVGEASPTGGDTEVRMPLNTAIPEQATHLLVYSKNAYGEYGTPGSALLRDAILPKSRPSGLKFEDEDGEKGEVSGTISVIRPENEDKIDEYSLHWGKSATRKIGTSSLIRDITKTSGKDPTHYISRNTKIPDGATYLLAFAKNEFGENPSPASAKIVDNTKPCLKTGDPDCVAAVTVSEDSDPDARQAELKISVSPATSEASIESYAVYWGRQACGTDGGQTGQKNGYISAINAGGNMGMDLAANTPVPEGSSFILIFPKNKYGESDFCVSASFVDNKANAADEVPPQPPAADKKAPADVDPFVNLVHGNDLAKMASQEL